MYSKRDREFTSFAGFHEYFLSFTSHSGWILGDACLIAEKNNSCLKFSGRSITRKQVTSSHVQAATISNKHWLFGRVTKAAIRTGVTDAHHHLDICFLITMHYSLWSWDFVREKKVKLTVKIFVNISKGKEQVFQHIVRQCTLSSLPDFSKGMKSSKNGLLFISSKTGEKTKRKCRHNHMDRA